MTDWSGINYAVDPPQPRPTPHGPPSTPVADWSGINYSVDPQTAAATHYDVVVVGSGVSGSILAKQVSLAGYRVLIMEAAGGDEVTVADYEKNVERFYTAVSK